LARPRAVSALVWLSRVRSVRPHPTVEPKGYARSALRLRPLRALRLRPLRFPMARSLGPDASGAAFVLGVVLGVNATMGNLTDSTERCVDADAVSDPCDCLCRPVSGRSTEQIALQARCCTRLG
jgi:hypothetical protein